MSPTPFEQANDLGERGGNRINGAIRRGISRESLFSRFLGSFDWMHFSAFAFPKAPATSVGHLPRPFPLSPLSHPLAHDYTRTAWARAGDGSVLDATPLNHKFPPQKPRGGDSKGDTDSVPFEALLER